MLEASLASTHSMPVAAPLLFVRHPKIAPDIVTCSLGVKPPPQTTTDSKTYYENLRCCMRSAQSSVPHVVRARQALFSFSLPVAGASTPALPCRRKNECVLSRVRGLAVARAANGSLICDLGRSLSGNLSFPDGKMRDLDLTTFKCLISHSP